LIKAETKLSRLTELCTISTGGAVFKPMVILKELKNLKSLANYRSLASFASSFSGWITSDLFLMFAIDFCAQLIVYRFMQTLCHSFGDCIEALGLSPPELPLTLKARNCRP
jgi:hypothetical protein